MAESRDDEIVVCVGKVMKVEEVPTKNGIVSHTETLIDFTDDAKLLQLGGYNGPAPLKQLVMMIELKYGKQYEVVLREIKPKMALSGNNRKIQVNND